MSLFWFGVVYLGANQVTSAITFPYFCFLCISFPRLICFKRRVYCHLISSQWCKYAKVVGDDNPPYLMIVVQVGVQVFTIAIACHPLSSTFTSKWKRNSGIILSFSMNGQGIMENKTEIWYHYKISRLGFQNSYSWFRWWNQWKQANSGKSLDLRHPFISPYWFLLFGCPFFLLLLFFPRTPLQIF